MGWVPTTFREGQRAVRRHRRRVRRDPVADALRNFGRDTSRGARRATGNVRRGPARRTSTRPADVVRRFGGDVSLGAGLGLRGVRAGPRRPATGYRVGIPGVATVTVPARVGNVVASRVPVIGTAITSPIPEVREIGHNAFQDVLDLPAQAVPSAYLTGQAIVEAAQGDTEKAEQMWAEFKKHDAWARLAQGDPEGAYRAFKEHPLITGLEVSGAGSALGRSVGFALRRGVGGARGRAFMSAERAPLEMYPEAMRDRTGRPGPALHREYSRNVMTKGIQVARENRARRRGEDPDLASRPERVRYMNRRVDQDVALTEALRRMGRDRTLVETAAMLPQRQRLRSRLGVSGQDLQARAVPLIVANIVRKPETLVEDLRAYREMVADTDVRNLSRSEQRVMQRTLDELDELLDDPDFLRNPAPAFEAAERFAASQDVRDRRQVELGLLDESELDSKNIPYAVVHMGARHVDDVDGTGRPGFVIEDDPIPPTLAREIEQAERKAEAAPKERDGRVPHYAQKVVDDLREIARRPELPQKRGDRVDFDIGEKGHPGDVKYIRRGDDGRMYMGQRGYPERAIPVKFAWQTIRQEQDKRKKIGPPVARYQQRIDRLAKEHGVELKEVRDWRRGKGGGDEDSITIPPLDRQAHYAVALHEIAHRALNHSVLVHRHRQVGVSKADEVEAWKWAMRELRERPDAETIGLVREALDSYDIDADAVVGPAARGSRELTAADVRAHMADNGVSGAGFFTMRPRARGRHNFYIRSIAGRGTRPANVSRRRTGEAVRRGTFDLDPEILVEQAVRSQGLIDAVEGFDRMLRDYAIRRPGADGGEGGWFGSFEEAYQFADELARNPDGTMKEGAVELVPVRLGNLSQEKLDRIREQLSDVNVPGERALETLSERLLDAFKRDTQGGQIVLVPKQVRDRLEAHNLRLSDIEKGAQKVSQVFKETVLPTSVKWLFGNLVDIGMRSAAYGLNPMAYARGRRLLTVMRELDPKLADAFESRTVQGAWFSSTDKLKVYRDAEQYVGTGLEGMARALGQMRRAPGVAQVIDLWGGYKRIVFGFNRMIEVHPQYAALGKLAKRDVRHVLSKQRGALALSDDALRDLAKGLRNTDAQVRYANYVQEIFGRWTANGPTARRLLINWMPFALWARAAGTFVFSTLPRKHPIKTAMLAAAYEMTEKEREALGLSLFADAEVRRPTFLQGGIPVSGGGTIRASGYTSFGIFSEFPESAADFVLPQFSGFVNTARGMDFKGDKLVHADGSEPNQGELALYAVYVQAEALFPFMSHARRIREDGGKTEFGSTAFGPRVKEGSEKGGAVERTFNPVMPVRRNPGKGDSGGLELDEVEIDDLDIDPSEIDTEDLELRLGG